MNTISKTLQKFNLTNQEIALYIASLMVGESGMTELAKKARLKRTTAYLAFKNLEKKGLMASFRMRRGARFVATDPELLIAKAKHQLDEITEIVPQLKAITEKGLGSPRISY